MTDTYFKAWREHLGYSQEQAALRMGASQSVISSFERGARNYTQQSLIALAKAYGCKPWELLAGPPGVRDVLAIFHSIPDELKPVAMRSLLGFIEKSDT